MRVNAGWVHGGGGSAKASGPKKVGQHGDPGSGTGRFFRSEFSMGNFTQAGRNAKATPSADGFQWVLFMSIVDAHTYQIVIRVRDVALIAQKVCTDANIRKHSNVYYLITLCLAKCLF